VKVLITSFGSFGDLNPYIGLGLELAARGHEPTLGVPGYYLPFVEAAGLHGRAIRPDVDPSQRELVRRIMDPLKGAEFLIRDLLMPLVEQSHEDLDDASTGADVIVSHPLTFAAPLVAARRGLPWASSVLAPIGFFSQSDPPLMAVLPSVATLQRKLPGLYRRLVPIARHVTRAWGKPVHDLRRKLGLPPGGDPVHEGQFSASLVLAMFSPLLASVQPDWPPNTVVTGAVSWDAVHGAMSPDLMRFLDAGPAPVVFTLGSSAVASADAPAFYRTSIEAASAAGMRAVLLVGRHDAHDLDTRGRAGVHVAEWAPHSDLFARAAVIVHQGGAGTLHTALASGRPMLIVPFAHDQGDNAVRTARLGVASVAFPSQYRARTVSRMLEALGAPDVVARARDVGAMVGAERGAATAVDALKAMLSTGKG
jgi:UDP:flavonoid glycosyltransferase YjiC (YdhE family)